MHHPGIGRIADVMAERLGRSVPDIVRVVSEYMLKSPDRPMSGCMFDRTDNLEVKLNGKN